MVRPNTYPTVYQAIVYNVMSQAPRDARGAFKKSLNTTRVLPVDRLPGAGPGTVTKGLNVHQGFVDPRTGARLGTNTIMIPGQDIAQLNVLLKHGNPMERKAAESALKTLSHETAHNVATSTGYEKRMARYLRENPSVLVREITPFIASQKGIGRKSAKKLADKAVRKAPRSMASQIAHAKNEAMADLMGTETAVKLAEGRHATIKDYERLNKGRPEIVRAYTEGAAMSRMGTQKRRRSSWMERASGKMEHFSGEFVEGMAKMDRTAHVRQGAAEMKERQEAKKSREKMLKKQRMHRRR